MAAPIVSREDLWRSRKQVDKAIIEKQQLHRTQRKAATQRQVLIDQKKSRKTGALPRKTIPLKGSKRQRISSKEIADKIEQGIKKM